MSELNETDVAAGDEVREAMASLRQRFFRRRGQDQVLLDFLEDELREGERAILEMQAWFDDALTQLSGPSLSAKTLADLASDPTVLDQLDELGETIAGLRKRLMQVAARVSGPTT